MMFTNKFLWISVIGLVLTGYFFYSQYRIEQLAGRLTETQQTIAIQQSTIKQLDEKLDVLSKATERFNQSATSARNNALNRNKELNNLPPDKQTEEEINGRINDIFKRLERIGR